MIQKIIVDFYAIRELSYLRKEGSEIVKVSQNPSTSMESVTISKQLSSAQGVSK
ncbi:hypothetical protein [Wolbachia endosymbiont (group B) of Catoptria pinella]|uniref:hypothetical protein n=1 Tax=Wolbachia endosymbiont (group B) of Catoptria pinella TaxID=2953993 RepID=UPI002226A7CD|nr:hypothetical protein [Wolbachia endosymbiont (group B) of Catoptria pinella]